MISVLRNEIYRLGKTVTGLSAANLYYDEAAPGLTGTYAIITGLSDLPSYDSGSVFEEVYWNIAGWAQTCYAVETLEKNIKTVFDLCSSFSVAGYSTIINIRISSIPSTKRGDLWNIVIAYKIELQKAR